ncbi:type II secretion system F family protein [Nocardioides sp. zg-536]|uniref:Type II secretion system F family protein n=1 Tax=Nocardioides faecalis TaxID=2803858 RepID=A0A938Y3F0_9ACTN|nr:type II secretion system F family protein [Nocardioides faecalis]MBM9461146.1 type II secretion system F family protein [Nocardioides faecalis]MBS4752200.1 type II secretion system F family protein [Nocardioides faecalis]QVI58999.1 type II secretion system F family protein [Nocardioides faecalis]
MSAEVVPGSAVALAVAAVASALLGALLVPARGGGLGGAGWPGGGAGRGRVVVLLGGGGVATWTVLAGSARWLVLAVLAAALVAGAARLLTARRRERRAAGGRARVVELCEALQAELAAGLSVPAALERAAMPWPAVAPAARAALGGGDVARALRAVAAEEPGAGSLRVVAAAWQVAHRTGHGLADAIGRVAEDLRAAEQTRRVVAGELASARATARLLAVLPVLALAMGSGAGADPWGFLLGHPVGLGCLGAGLGLAYAGLAWIDALAGAVERDAG